MSMYTYIHMYTITYVLDTYHAISTSLRHLASRNKTKKTERSYRSPVSYMQLVSSQNHLEFIGYVSLVCFVLFDPRVEKIRNETSRLPGNVLVPFPFFFLGTKISQLFKEIKSRSASSQKSNKISLPLMFLPIYQLLDRRKT